MDQEMMWMRRALLRIAAAAPLSALAAATHAGPIRALSRMFNNTIQLKVTVIDEQRRPVPYATLCFLYGHALAPELSVNDMVRLVNRYRRDYDLVAVGSGSPFSAVLMRWANFNGTYSGEIRENDYQRLASDAKVNPRGNWTEAKAPGAKEFAQHVIDSMRGKRYEVYVISVDRMRSARPSTRFSDWK